MESKISDSSWSYSDSSEPAEETIVKPCRSFSSDTVFACCVNIPAGLEIA